MALTQFPLHFVDFTFDFQILTSHFWSLQSFLSFLSYHQLLLSNATCAASAPKNRSSRQNHRTSTKLSSDRKFTARATSLTEFLWRKSTNTKWIVRMDSKAACSMLEVRFLIHFNFNLIYLSNWSDKQLSLIAFYFSFHFNQWTFNELARSLLSTTTKLLTTITFATAIGSFAMEKTPRVWLRNMETSTNTARLKKMKKAKTWIRKMVRDLMKTTKISVTEAQVGKSIQSRRQQLQFYRCQQQLHSQQTTKLSISISAEIFWSFCLSFDHFWLAIKVESWNHRNNLSSIAENHKNLRVFLVKNFHLSFSCCRVKCICSLLESIESIKQKPKIENKKIASKVSVFCCDWCSSVLWFEVKIKRSRHEISPNYVKLWNLDQKSLVEYFKLESKSMFIEKS